MRLADAAIVFAVAFGVTFGLTPIAVRAARRIGVVAHPQDRHIHTRPTPLLGGAAMFAGLGAAMLTAWQLDSFETVFRTTEPLGVMAAAGAIFVVGLLDDVREVSPPAKLAGQVFAGSLLYLLGVTMFFFRIPFADTVVLSPDLAPLVTVLWVVGMANAVNFIDGLDGLAAGVVAIAAGAMFLYSLRLFDEGLIGADNLSPLVSVIALGLCLGFLPWNFNPARIFMGDAGALLLGLLMASATIVVGGRADDPYSGQTFFFFAPLFIPLFILGVPILDAALAIVRRIRRRQDPSVADREHLHHRLVELGHGQRRSVLILWGWTALLSAFVLYPTYTGRGNHVVPIAVVGFGVALYTLFHPGARRARALSNGTHPSFGDADAEVRGDGSALEDVHPE